MSVPLEPESDFGRFRDFERRIQEAREQDEEQLVCRVCGCTDEEPCEWGCFWVEPGLCSACADLEGE